MPASIPFDHPSLVLGNIIDTTLLNKLKQINNSQAKIEAAQEKLNSYIMLKRSLSMTITELIELDVDVSEINAKVKEVDGSISQAAVDYLSARIINEDEIQAARLEILEIEPTDSMESPLDYGVTKIIHMPLSADSIKMDSQYFSYEGNDEGVEAGIESFIKESTANMGARSGELSKAVTQQISTQKKNHSLSGTLIITASCTHQNTAILEPMVLDPDKALSAWNSVFTDVQIPENAIAIREIAEASVEAGNIQSLSIVSGAAYGSSFVGMVHILRKDVSEAQNKTILDPFLQESMKMGRWLADESGAFGVNPDVLKNVQKLLHEQEISSHVSIVCMGAILGIGSNELKTGISTLVKPNPKQITESLAALSAMTSSDKNTPESTSQEAKTGQRMITMQNTILSNALQELSSIDQKSNKIMDINTLIKAFENYIEVIKDTQRTVGIPINFFLKKITKVEIAKKWLNKYYPESQSEQ